jgi:signal transduction histidine kinase
MHSVIEGSRQTVAVAIRILGGEKAADIKIPAIGFATPQFNWREMQRWGISETRLPAGSEIFFRDPTAWEQYRVQILGTVAIVLGQSALIGWLLYEHRRRRRSEAAAHDLSGRLINAHEEERARLARELHDDVTQRLAMLAIDAGRKERVLSGSAADTVMREMREGLVRLSEDVHALSYRLHPSILEDLGLIEALKAECERSRPTPGKFPNGCRTRWRSACFASHRRDCAISHATPARTGRRSACGAWTAGCSSL